MPKFVLDVTASRNIGDLCDVADALLDFLTNDTGNVDWDSIGIQSFDSCDPVVEQTIYRPL